MFHVKHFGTFCSKISVMKNKFSERLSALRAEEKMSRGQLALRLNVSVRLISYWENGERECGFDMLLRIADIFSVSCDYLLGKTDY